MSDVFSADPLEQLLQWHEEALRVETDPNAMTLATANKNGKPSARIVLFKGIEEDGLLIFTNYKSRKAVEMRENPYAAAIFYWPKLYRQIRIEAKVHPISAESSRRYFFSRPYESQLSAWVSEQSQPISDRKYLETRYKKYHEQFKPGEVPCPEFWGGFRLIPEEIEFWIGRAHRLHDRFCYRKEDNHWNILRLAP